jgi:hypothetical protein
MHLATSGQNLDLHSGPQTLFGTEKRRKAYYEFMTRLASQIQDACFQQFIPLGHEKFQKVMNSLSRTLEHMRDRAGIRYGPCCIMPV